jgi:hypothetical protein
MKANHQKTVRKLLFLICLLAVSWVQAATYQLTFFDGNKKVVGNGQFTTDPNKELCIVVGSNGNCSGPPPISSVF